MAAGLDPEALLAEAAWLRRLAVTLAGDADDADDLVQQSWITAWRRNPDTSRPLRPWLAKVVRDESRMRRRSDARRAQREAAIADADVASAPDEILDQVRLHKVLVDLVLELEEPYRSTVLARYVNGQTSAAIAKRLNIAESTVRWRLHEALARLRTRLDNLNGDRKAWAPAAVAFTGKGVEAGAAEAAATTGKALLAMKTTKFLVIGLVVILAAVVAWHWQSSRPQRSKPQVSETRSAAASSASVTSAADSRSRTGSPTVRKLENREMRDQLLVAIRAAHEQRMSKASKSAAPSATPPRAHPGSAEDKAEADDPDADYIRDAMSALLPMVVDCYKQARLVHPALAGTLVVNFTIEGEPGVGGVVTESAIDPEKSEIKDSDLGQCVEETMFALEIDPPLNGGTVTVTFPFTFRPKD